MMTCCAATFLDFLMMGCGRSSSAENARFFGSKLCSPANSARRRHVDAYVIHDVYVNVTHMQTRCYFIQTHNQTHNLKTRLTFFKSDKLIDLSRLIRGRPSKGYDIYTLIRHNAVKADQKFPCALNMAVHRTACYSQKLQNFVKMY